MTTAAPPASTAPTVVDLRPAEIVDVALRFSDHAGRFVLHCMAMMATIRTVCAGNARDPDNENNGEVAVSSGPRPPGHQEPRIR